MKKTRIRLSSPILHYVLSPKSYVLSSAHSRAARHLEVEKLGSNWYDIPGSQGAAAYSVIPLVLFYSPLSSLEPGAVPLALVRPADNEWSSRLEDCHLPHVQGSPLRY